MNTELALKKLEQLPDSVQLQVFDYIDFLSFKYFEIIHKEDQIKEESDDFVVTDEVKGFLDKRIAHHNANPENVKPWEDVINRIAKKYNYEL